MNSRIIAAAISVMLFSALIVAGCGGKTDYSAPAQDAPQAAAPDEVTLAEQSVEEIGTSDLDEMESEADELTVP